MGVVARLSLREPLQPLVRLMVAHHPATSMKHDKRGGKKKWRRISYEFEWLRMFCSGWWCDGRRHEHANLFQSKGQTWSFSEIIKFVTLSSKTRKMHRSLVTDLLVRCCTDGASEAPSFLYTETWELSYFSSLILEMWAEKQPLVMSQRALTPNPG